MAKTRLAQEVKERPIIFGAWKLKRILEWDFERDGDMQTRRVLRDSPLTKPPYYFDHISYDLGYPASLGFAWAGFRCEGQDADASALYEKCPHGKPGGRLWVREALMKCEDSEGSAPLALYKAGRQPVMCYGEPSAWGWRGETLSPIFMPRWASRVTLELTDVRVERLQDIRTRDIEAEGVLPDEHYLGSANRLRHPFTAIWDALNKARGFGWGVNPWVFVLSFRRVQDARA